MIFDCIANSENYVGLHKNFAKAFEFIKKAVIENYPVGRYEIDGADIYAMVQQYDTRIEQHCKYEGHRKYIDIQYMIEGRENVDVTDIKNAKGVTEFDEENDYGFFETNESVNTCVLTDGDYVILLPYDIHRPGRAFKNEPAPVKKIVVKVKL